MTRRTAATLAAGLLLGAGSAACAGQGTPTAAGEVVPGRSSVEVTGDSGFVLIPTGRLDLTVGAPTAQAVPADQANDDEEHAAPDGGSWIPVHVEHDPFGEGGVPVGLIGGRPQPAGLALVVDGTTTRLDAPYRVVGDKGTADSGVGTVWVAVDEAPDAIGSLSFAVTYDGLTQTLDPSTGERGAGAAAPLYDEPTVHVEASCPADGFDQEGLEADLACRVGPPQRTPYLPGCGWAAAGTAWLVVGASIAIDAVDVDGTSYDVGSLELHATVNGNEPQPPRGQLGRVEARTNAVDATWAFEASAQGPDQLVLTLDLVLDKANVDAPGPAAREATLTQTVALGG